MQVLSLWMVVAEYILCAKKHREFYVVVAEYILCAKKHREFYVVATLLKNLCACLH